MEKETSRMGAFNDGVFAIVLTLLIVGIKVPDLNNISTKLIEDVVRQTYLFHLEVKFIRSLRII
jgi:uncharacterized membrane protein